MGRKKKLIQKGLNTNPLNLAELNYSKVTVTHGGYVYKNSAMLARGGGGAETGGENELAFLISKS